MKLLPTFGKIPVLAVTGLVTMVGAGFAEVQERASVSESEARALIGSLAAKLEAAQNELALLKASRTLGTGEAATLSLLAELRLTKVELSKLQANRQEGQGAYGGQQGKVIDILEPERTVILSLGREVGVLEGALLKVGSTGVLVKVVESRVGLSAAVVQNSYQGKLADLVGVTAQLSAR